MKNFDMFKYDLSRIIVTLLFVNILKSNISKSELLFNKKLLYTIIGYMCSYSVYDIIFYNTIKYNILNKINNLQLLLSIEDIIKYICVYVFNNLIITTLCNTKDYFNDYWKYNTLGLIIGYVILDNFGMYLPNLGEKYQLLLNDICQWSLGIILGNLFTYNKIQYDYLLYINIGLIIYHLFIRKIITNYKPYYYGMIKNI